MQRPQCRIGGVWKEMPAGEKPFGFWARSIAVPAGGAVTATIPAGVFVGLPVIGHTIQSTGARDYVFRLAALTFNSDKTITIAGLVRQSQPVTILGGDPYGALTTPITLHIVAIESD